MSTVAWPNRISCRHFSVPLKEQIIELRFIRYVLIRIFTCAICSWEHCNGYHATKKSAVAHAANFLVTPEIYECMTPLALIIGVSLKFSFCKRRFTQICHDTYAYFYRTPKGDSKTRFHAGFSHKSSLEIAYNSYSRQVYPITLDVTLIIHEITQFFHPIPISRSKICQITPSRFPLGRPLSYGTISIRKAPDFWRFSIIKVSWMPGNYDFASINLHERPKQSRNRESFYPG